MARIAGGEFRMGSEDFYPEERPVRTVSVGDVRWDRHPVTNAEFARFVEETGHVTVAEIAPDPADFPGADPALLVPGSQVFTLTAGPVSASANRQYQIAAATINWPSVVTKLTRSAPITPRPAANATAVNTTCASSIPTLSIAG